MNHDGVTNIVVVHPTCQAVVSREERRCGKAKTDAVTHPVHGVLGHACPEHPHHPRSKTGHCTVPTERGVCGWPVALGQRCALHPEAEPTPAACKTLLGVVETKCGYPITGDGQGCPRHPGHGARYFG